MHSPESYPPAEYFAANHDRFVGLLDLSSELVLRYDPVVTVMAEATRLPSISVWGQELEEYDPASPDGADAVARAHEARQRLSDFTSRVSLRLLAGEVASRAPGSAEGAGVATSDQARRVAAAVHASERTYASLAFEGPEAGQQVTVEAMTMHGKSAPLARGLVLYVDDGLLARNVTVGHLEQPPVAVEPPSWVIQAVGPTRDDETQRMAEFFLQERNDLAGFAALLELFRRELQGQSSEELLTDVYERYENAAMRTQLTGFVSVMRQRAWSARRQRGLLRQNPELARPSSAELDEYTQLFRSLLG